MKPKIIKTEAEYDTALARVAKLTDARPGTAKADELELWATLVDLYEREAHPIDLPDPISAIRFRMEQQGLNRSDLIQYIGSKGKVSEVLSGKRSLSLSMIRNLHYGLGIPAEALLGKRGAKTPQGLSRRINKRLRPTTARVHLPRSR
jgi:HTH-type transcriptional regulator/antitoxin HigA